MIDLFFPVFLVFCFKVTESGPTKYSTYTDRYPVDAGSFWPAFWFPCLSSDCLNIPLIRIRIQWSTGTRSGSMLFRPEHQTEPNWTRLDRTGPDQNALPDRALCRACTVLQSKQICGQGTFRLSDDQRTEDWPGNLVRIVFGTLPGDHYYFVPVLSGSAVSVSFAVPVRSGPVRK